jgi:hypothetical protein
MEQIMMFTGSQRPERRMQFPGITKSKSMSQKASLKIYYRNLQDKARQAGGSREHRSCRKSPQP